MSDCNYNIFHTCHLVLDLLDVTSTGVGNKFELKRTLQSGEIIFSNSRFFEEEFALAQSRGNILLFDTRTLDQYDTVSHEIIHNYQYYERNFVNTYLNKSFEGWRSKSDTFNKINDLFYFDMQGILLRSLYLLENQNRNTATLITFLNMKLDFIQIR